MRSLVFILLIGAACKCDVSPDRFMSTPRWPLSLNVVQNGSCFLENGDHGENDGNICRPDFEKTTDS